MRIVHDSVGGFTAPLGKQSNELDLGQLSASAAAQLRAQIAQVPVAAWGQQFLSPQVKSYDFRHTIRVIDDDGAERAVSFHEKAAPPALQQLLKTIQDADA